MTLQEFQQQIRAGIPSILPEPKPYDTTINHAPKRKDILSPEQKELALRNALRYFAPEHHSVLAPEFAEELARYGRIYMYRLRPEYEMYARPIDHYPARSPMLVKEKGIVSISRCSPILVAQNRRQQSC